MSATFRDIRLAVLAGLTGGTVVAAVPIIGARVAALRAATPPAIAAPTLGDPVAAATAALARGEARYLVVATTDGLIVPGLTARGVVPERLAEFKLYSPQSTGLRGAAWTDFERRVLAYAAAFNVTLHVKGAPAAL